MSILSGEQCQGLDSLEEAVGLQWLEESQKK